MRVASIFGYPKNCCNTNCKHPFSRESHLGWLPRTDIEVYAVLKCEKCKSKFKVVQRINESYEFFQTLPETKTPTKGKISEQEIIKVKNILAQNNNLLNELNGGMIPGLSQTIKPYEHDEF